MPSLLIKGIPERLHQRLREAAEDHQRSMNQEAILALSQALDLLEPFPKPIKIKKPFTDAYINRAKREGRL